MYVNGVYKPRNTTEGAPSCRSAGVLKPAAPSWLKKTCTVSIWVNFITTSRPKPGNHGQEWEIIPNMAARFRWVTLIYPDLSISMSYSFLREDREISSPNTGLAPLFSDVFQDIFPWNFHWNTMKAQVCWWFLYSSSARFNLATAGENLGSMWRREIECL